MKDMKINNKIGIVMCMILLISFTSACSLSNTGPGKDTKVTKADCLELVTGMMDDKEYEAALVTYGDTEFDNVMEVFYDLNVDLEDGAIIYSVNSRAYEWAVLEVSGKKDIKAVKDAFANRKEQRSAAYYGYFPEETKMIDDGLVYSRGNYVVLAICDDEASAKEGFNKTFEMTEDELEALSDKNAVMIQKYRDAVGNDDKNTHEDKSDNNGSGKNNASQDNNDVNSEDNTDSDIDNNEKSEDDKNNNENNSNEVITSENDLKDIDDSTYYNQDIVRAVKTRDMSILTEPKDQAIYKAAVAVIDSVITEDMTDVEKEKAVHDYLCINMDYDIPAVDDESKADPDADNPYGMLVGHYGICSGYASTFKLFMDCFDIECIIVEGKANGLEEDHAWNKIHIDGKWYNVDVTWDDPVYYDEQGNVVTESWDENYQFFNCQDNVLEATEHYWNHDLYPESDD